jgi:DNA-binding NtrC family response regulator
MDMIKSPAQTTILLLVSDQLVRAVTQETLENEGYLVLATGDLGSAVERLKEIAPDLLITRLYVSNLPGHQAAKYLRTKRPEMRVLIMSGLLDDDRLIDRAALEGFEVFPKPYSASEFLEKVRETLSKPRDQAGKASASVAARKES